MFQRITAIFFGIFGVLSFLLAILFIWEVLSYNSTISTRLLISFVMVAFIALVLNITAKLLEKK